MFLSETGINRYRGISGRLRQFGESIGLLKEQDYYYARYNEDRTRGKPSFDTPILVPIVEMAEQKPALLA